MKPYTRYPPDIPPERGVRILVVLMLLVLALVLLTRLSRVMG